MNNQQVNQFATVSWFNEIAARQDLLRKKNTCLQSLREVTSSESEFFFYEPVGTFGEDKIRGVLQKLKRKDTGAKVAMKSIKLSYEQSQTQHIINEISILKLHKIDHIVKYFDSFVSDDAAYIMMEHVDGLTLAQVMARKKLLQGNYAGSVLT